MIGANFLLNLVLPHPPKMGYGEHGKRHHVKLKPLFHFLPALDPETLPIFELELFVTIGNDFQSLIFVSLRSSSTCNDYQR